jgi:hypothetical protein
LNFNKRLFSRKKFKRFWYRNSFVPIIDDNPVRFSENFHNFKSYESGLPIIPSFSENVKDPISKVLERGIRRPIVKDTYSDFLSNLYYKRFYSYIIDNYNVERSFHGWLHEDIAAYDSPSVGQDYLPYSKFIYKTYFNPCNVDKKEVYFKRSVLGYFYQNELLKKLYILNLSRSGSSKLFKKNNFVKGNNSRFYLNQLYRYPFSRSIYRVYYDAINEEEYIRNRIRPGSSLNIFENSTIYIPYFGEKYLYTPIYNQKLNSFEDNRTFVSDYLEDRFANTKYIIDKGNGENIFEPVPPEYSSILDNTVFVWGGRHTGAFFFDNFAKIIKKDFNPYNLQTLDSKTFNEFPFTSNISSKDTNFIKNISTFLSDLSSDDTEALFDYTKEYDWPILEVIFEPMDETNDDDTTFYEPIKYPYNSDIDSYTNTSSIMFSNNNLNSFKSELDADFVPEDEVGKGLDYNFTLKDLKFLQDVTLGELEEEGDFDSSREFFSKIKFINNIGININYGTDVITYQDRKNSSKKVINKVFDEFKDFEIEYDEDLENQEEEEEESYFNEKLGSNYFFSLYFERPIYSRNYSKIFQRKDAFSFALFDRLSNFNINFFDRKSDRRYWLRFPESEMDKMDTNRFNKPSTYKTIYSYYSDNKNRLYFSPLEKYIINSYGNIIRNYSHFNYPFSRYGNKINNLIFERRSLFRSRITSRLQKYVYSKAFEKTFNRVFSGSRVPVTSIDPFKVLINEKEGYPSFEMWADDESTNIFSSTLDLDALSPNFDANLRWKLEQLKNNDRDFRKKKIGNYINTYKLSNKDSEIFKSENEMFYPHINLESILYKKLEIARKKNPRFISNKDLFFVKKNAKLLEKRSEKYLKNDTFIRQTYTGMDFYKYIVLNELRNSNKYEKDISKIRSELNKVRPGYSTHNFKLSKIEIYNNSDFQKVENKDNIKDTELFNKNKFRIDKVQIVNKERRRGEVK